MSKMFIIYLLGNEAPRLPLNIFVHISLHTHTIHEKCRSFGCIKAMKEEKFFLTKPQSIQAIIYHFA